MNSSGEELQGYFDTTKRYQKEIIAKAKEREAMKQEILDKVNVEIRDKMNQKKIEIVQEIIDIFSPDLETLENNMFITRDKMKEFFDKFLKDFSYVVKNIEDPQTKTAFHELIKKTLKKLEEW